MVKGSFTFTFAYNSPNVMREIGRLREIAFRAAGGGTGKDCDIDEFDTMMPPCQQLVVWDPDAHLILGGYRFIIGKNIKMKDGKPNIATSHMFNFSQEFINNYLPYTPKSLATAASSSLEPMTQSLPVMAALPIRTSASPGT